jgi:hypothetical protein
MGTRSCNSATPIEACSLLRLQPQLDKPADGLGTGHIRRVLFNPSIEDRNISRWHTNPNQDRAHWRSSDLFLSVIRYC